MRFSIQDDLIPTVLTRLETSPDPRLQQAALDIRNQLADDTSSAADKLRKVAEEMYGCDDIEVDNDAQISISDEHAFVQAWVYVPYSALDERARLDLAEMAGAYP